MDGGDDLPEIYEEQHSFDVRSFQDNFSPMTYEAKSTVAKAFLDSLPPEDRIYGLTYLQEMNKNYLRRTADDYLRMASQNGVVLTRTANDKVTHFYDY